MATLDEDWRNDTQNFTQTDLKPLPPDWTRMLCQLQWAWDVHVYGAASLFCLMSVLCLLTVLRLNSQLTERPHLSSLNIFLGILATSRFIVLFADPYGSRKALPVVLLQVLWDLGYPCLLSALALLQLSFVRTTQVKMAQVSDESTATVIITLHFCFVITTGVLAALQRSLRIVWLLVQVLFLVWGCFLCLSSLLGCVRLLRSLVTLRSVAQVESRHAMFLVEPQPTPRICITGAQEKTASMASLQVERTATAMPQRSETFPMTYLPPPNEGRPLMSIAFVTRGGPGDICFPRFEPRRTEESEEEESSREAPEETALHFFHRLHPLPSQSIRSFLPLFGNCGLVLLSDTQQDCRIHNDFRYGQY